MPNKEKTKKLLKMLDNEKHNPIREPGYKNLHQRQILRRQRKTILCKIY